MKEEKKIKGLFERPRGSGVWWIRYADSQSRERREKAGSKSDAIKLYQKRKVDAWQGRKLPENLRKLGVTFEAIAEQAIDDIERRYRRPGDDVSRLHVVIGWFGSRAAESLTAPEIESRLLAEKEAQGWAPSTYNHHRSVISLAFRLARKSDQVKVNPVRDVAHLAENNSRVRSLSAKDEGALRKAIRTRYPGHEVELDFALHTGLRQGNQFRLEWSMVDFDNQVLHIPQTKNGDALTLPLNAAAVMILRGLQSQSTGVGRIFISSETGKPLVCPKHWFTDAVRLANLRDFHWHDLRHTFATRLREHGTPLEDIAVLLGHKGLTMTKRYAHPNMAALHAAVDRLSAKPTGTRTGTGTEQVAAAAPAVLQ